MNYRAYKIKYEHIVFALLIMKGNLNMDLQVNLYEFISYKVEIIKKIRDLNISITLDLSPKIRKKFEDDYNSMIDTFYDFDNGLTYSLKNKKYINFLIDKMQDEISENIYNVLLEESIFIKAMDENVLKIVKKRKRK